MTTLIVQLPPRDTAADPAQWQLGTLPFVLFDRRKRVLRTGHATLALLPKAHTTVLLIAARDLLLLNVPLAPLSRRRLRTALPNVVEDRLLQDAHRCHIALEPISPRAAASRSEAAAPRMRRLAVIDCDWFRFIHTTLTEAGHLRLHALPIASCLPETETETETEGETSGWRALICDFHATDSHPPLMELALARGAHAEGLSVPADALADTLTTIAQNAPVMLYQLPHAAHPAALTLSAPLKAQPLPFETLARAALECRFDLCQFEFAAPLWHIPQGARKRWRIPGMLLMASILIALLGANMHWRLLARQRDALQAAQAETLLSAFPETQSVLDAPRQMARQLDLLRIQAGVPAPDDFLSLAQGLARALGAHQAGSIAQLRYRDRMLEVTFKAGVKLDAAFQQRLADHGLSGRVADGNWILSVRTSARPSRR